MWLRYGSFFLGGLLISTQTGCGSAPAPATVTMTATQTITQSASPVTTTIPTFTTATPAQQTAPATTRPATTTVPNGVGLNYQAAQDLWRANGLVVLPAIDALGAHRLPVIDANWFVVAQDLKPGSVVEWGSGITATVKKYTDD